jgi:hypothetical protein
MLRLFSINKLKQTLSINRLNSKSISISSVRFNLQDEWKILAEKQLKGKPVDSLSFTTSEVFSKHLT